MKRILILTLVLLFACSAGAYASLPVGTQITPSPDDYTSTDLSEFKTVYMYLIGDGESTYPDFPEILAEINKTLAEYNTELNVHCIPYSDAHQMYALALTGGDKVDLIFAASWWYFWTNAAQEAFFTLDEEFLNTYMPYTAQYQADDSWIQVTYNGLIQGVSQNRTQQNCRLLAIRTDLGEQYGLDIDFTTWDGYKAYLLGIAEHTEETGIFAYNAGKIDTDITRMYHRSENMFYVGGSSWYRFLGAELPAPEDIFFYYDSESFRNWIDIAYELANAGCWSRNALSKVETADEAFQNGTGASYAHNFGVYTVSRALEQDTLGVEQMSATKCILLYPEYPVASEGYNNNIMCITSFSEDPYRAAMVLDILKFDTRINELVILGVEGRHWTDLGDGYFENGPDYAKYTPGGISWAWALHNGNWTAKPYRADEQEMSEFANSHLYVDPTLAFSFDPEPIAAYEAAISATVDEYSQALILGLVDDPDVAFANFCDLMNTAGLETYNEEYTAQYRAWYDSI